MQRVIDRQKFYEIREKKITPRGIQALLRGRAGDVSTHGELISKRLTRTRRKTGRPPKLSVEDQLLLTLEYWREYRTLFHLAKSWGLHESNVCRVIRRVEDILTKSRAFRLPGKKRLQPSDHQIEFIVVDVAETPIERPKKSRKPTTAAKRSGTP